MQIARLNSAPEIFHSLQGEGARAGIPAVFLRLAGCNLRCRWCDTKYSWGSGIEMTPEQAARAIQSYGCRSLVITGGEPLLQQEELEQLLALLPEVYTEVETNGTIKPSESLLRRVNQWNVSPKLTHAGNTGCCTLDSEVAETFLTHPGTWFKFVVRGEEDWADIAALNLPEERIILMPCAADLPTLNAVRPAVAKMCLRHNTRLGDRLHIVLWNTAKGV